MKVKIKNYASFFGPYQFMDWLFWGFGKKNKYGQREYPEWHDKLSERYADSWPGKANAWLAGKWLKYWGDRRVSIKLDPWDTWNMDETLAHIILPMLKQLKETKHGSPLVDDEDVPHLPKQQWTRNESDQRDMFADDEYDDLVWDQYEVRWSYVLDEMIWAFETQAGNNTDWEDQFHSGKTDIYFEDLDDGSGMSEMKRGPTDTHKFDREGHREYSARIENGFRLFGKYYRGLWD